MDSSGIILNINDTALKLFNFKQEEVIGKTIFELDIFNKRDLHKFTEYYNQLNKGIIPHIDKMSLISKDGRSISGRPKISIINFKDHSFYQIIFEDISTQEEFEKSKVSLLESELLNKTILDTMNNYIFTIEKKTVNANFDYKIVSVNEYLKKNFDEKFEIKNIVGESIYKSLSFLPPDFLDSLVELFNEKSKDSVYNNFLNFYFKNEYFCWEILKKPIFKDQEIVQVIVVIKDITKQRRKENFQYTIQEISSTFASNYDQNNAFDRCLSKVRDFTYCDRAYLFVLNESNNFIQIGKSIKENSYVREQLFDVPFHSLEFIDKELRQGNTIFLYDTRNQDESSADISDLKVINRNFRLIRKIDDSDLLLLRRNGVKSILITPFFVEGLLYGFIGIDNLSIFKKWSVEDIDLLYIVSEMIGNAFERSNFLKNLEESQLRYKKLFEASPNIIIVTDLKGFILDANPAFESFRKKILENKKKNNIISIFKEEQLKAIYSGLKDIDQDFINRFEFKFINNLKQEYFFECDSRRISLKSGIVVIQLVIQDITERKKSEEMQRQFFDMAAHELKNPLSSLVWAAESVKILCDKIIGKNDDLEKFVKFVTGYSFFLKSIATNLLTYSRFEKMKLILNKESINAKEMLETVIYPIQCIAITENKQINILDLTQKDFILTIDRHKMMQVLINLLLNSIKSIKHTGEIFFNTYIVKDQAYISVKDTGVGLTEAEKELLLKKLDYEPYSISSEGFGLGLFVVNKYVKLHNGNVKIISEGKDKGTEVLITLPQ